MLHLIAINFRKTSTTSIRRNLRDASGKFSDDLDGQPMNTAQVTERQTLRNAENVDMSQTMGQLGGLGLIK